MKLGSEEIFYINVFNSVCGATARDVVVRGKSVAFLVKEGDIGKAIGRNACNVKALKRKLRKNVEIVEHSSTVEGFVKKALYNVRVREVKLFESNGRRNALVSLEPGEKMKLLGSMGRFKRISEIAQRNYGLSDLRIK